MGGFGSGNWSNILTRKISVERCRVLSVRQLRLAGLFSSCGSVRIDWRNAGGESAGVTLVTLSGGELIVRDDLLEYKIGLEKKACRFGGFRYYFLCPAAKDGVHCGGRVSKLFLPPAGNVFGCKDCYDLTYQSCQESHKYDKVFGHIEGIDIKSLSVTQALRLGGLGK